MDNLFSAICSVDEKETPLSSVKRLFIPDGVAWCENDIYHLNQLETVSLSARDYWRARDINNTTTSWKYELRIPTKEEFMHTVKTDSMLEFLFKKCGKKKVYDKFATVLAIEYVNHCWTEEQALTLMASVMIESGTIHDISELNTWIDPDLDASFEKIYEDITIHQKANFIKNNSLLKSVYAIRGYVDNKLGIVANSDLYEIISHVNKFGDGHFNLMFNDNISIEHNCLLGFDGTGSLKGTKYFIMGESTPELNKQIIRLTSDYQLQGNNMKLFPTPYLLKLNFLGQHWFEKNAKMGMLWSYPNGEIYDEGFIEDSITTEEILTDLACLGSQFAGLKLDVFVMCRYSYNNDNDHIPIKDNALVFKLENGKVRVEWTDHVYVKKNTHSEIREIYKDKQFQIQSLLDNDYIEYINFRNRYEMYSNSGKEEAIHIVSSKPFDEYILCYLDMYMQQNYGWSFHFNENTLKMNQTDICLGYQLLRLLFHGYDVNEIIQTGRKTYEKYLKDSRSEESEVVW